MAPTKRGTGFETPIVVCVMSFSSAALPGNEVIQRGARLRADEPIVQANRAYFAPDGLSDAEYKSRYYKAGGLNG